MTRPSLACALPLAATLALALPGSLLAQGTAEEREACADDAIKLCPDTIPDEQRTAACMRRHEAQLSPRCHRVFLAATRPGGGARDERREEPAPRERSYSRETPPNGDAPDSRPDDGRYGDDRYGDGRPREGRRDYDEPDGRAMRDPPPESDYGPRRYRYLAPNGDAAETTDPRDRARARAEIERLCEDDMLDARSCAATQRALDR